jgi:hypothetical protein
MSYSDEDRINIILDTLLLNFNREDVIDEIFKTLEVDEVLDKISDDDIISYYDRQELGDEDYENPYEFMKDLVDSSFGSPDYHSEIGLSKQYILRLTNSLDKQRMLEYLVDNFKDITLEDLETIIKNK